MKGNDETDEESSPSNENGLPASDLEGVQNDVVVKLEEITDGDENHLQNPSTDDPSNTSSSDVQNVEVKMEQIDNWEYNEDY